MEESLESGNVFSNLGSITKRNWMSAKERFPVREIHAFGTMQHSLSVSCSLCRRSMMQSSISGKKCPWRPEVVVPATKIKLPFLVNHSSIVFNVNWPTINQLHFPTNPLGSGLGVELFGIREPKNSHQTEPTRSEFLFLYLCSSRGRSAVHYSKSGGVKQET